MQRPVEVDVDEGQQIVERVAAIDVAKATGTVCSRRSPRRRRGQAGDQGVGGEGDHQGVG